MTKRKIHLYCADEDEFILKLEGEDDTHRFATISEAFKEAGRLKADVPLLVYSRFGKVVLETIS